MADHEWELSKENVAPLRQGRDVQVLNKALKTPKAQLEAQRIVREGQVRDAVSGHGSQSGDPLQAWSMYIKWLVENYPAGCDVLVRAIEEVCRTYARSERYRDDIRLLRLWIRYVDLRQDKIDAFNYMHRRRIGESWSLFYEAWAITLELARRYDDAQKVYRDGRERNAKPLERLVLREEEYHSRMTARTRRDEKKRLDAERRRNTELRREEARKEQTGVRSRNSLADTILSVPDAGASASDSNSLRTARPALGRITEIQAKSGLRPMTLERKLRSSEPRVTETQKRGQTIKDQAFEVYTDPDNFSVSNVHGADHNPKRTDVDEQILPELARRDEVRKENEGLLPTKWAGQVLPQENTLHSKLRTEASKPFEVFQDPAKVSSPSDPIIAAAIRDVQESQTEETSGHNQIREGRIGREKTLGSTTPKSWQRCNEEGYASPTINTKLAMKEVDDIFNSSHSQSFSKGYSSILGESIDAKYGDCKSYADDGSMARKLNNGADGRNRDVNPSHSPRGSENGSPTPFPKHAIEAQEGNGTAELSRYGLEAAKSGNGSGVLQASGGYDMTEFLASWCNSDSHFQLLEDPDPDVVQNDIFDLHCRQGLVSFHVDKFRWTGCTGQSYVVLADDLNNSFGLMNVSEELGSDDEDFKVVAIKVSESSNAWEYYIYQTVHSRLATPSKSIPHAVAFCEGNPRSFLVLDSHSRCSLHAAQEFYVDKKFPEILAMFFIVSVLRVIEELHGIGVIHADLTLDNILFRYDLAADISKTAYSASGGTEWANWGVLLVDFNRSVDARHPEVSGMDILTLGRHLRKTGDFFLDSDYRVPNADDWAYNADCNAIKTCATKMLGLSDFDTRGPMNELQHAQTWQKFFSRMQELEGSATDSKTREAMTTCSNEMGKVLEEDRLLSVSLMQLVNHVVDAENDEMTKGF